MYIYLIWCVYTLYQLFSHLPILTWYQSRTFTFRWSSLSINKTSVVFIEEIQLFGCLCDLPPSSWPFVPRLVHHHRKWERREWVSTWSIVSAASRDSLGSSWASYQLPTNHLFSCGPLFAYVDHGRPPANTMASRGSPNASNQPPLNWLPPRGPVLAPRWTTVGLPWTSPL